MIVVDAAPGEGPTLHRHGTQELLVRGGEIVIVGPDQPHGFANSGSGRLRQIDVHLSPRFATEWLER